MIYIAFSDEIKPVKSYMTCVHSIKKSIDKDKYYRVVINYALMVKKYIRYAINGDLYIFSNHKGMLSYKNLFNTDDISTDDLKNLYTKMVDNKEPRKIYNKLISLAPLDRCPYCGIGQVSTLDHYLPKSKFPTFSVLPYNLVPSCKDCNTGKGQSFTTVKEEQTLHPYYDDFTKEQWLFAEVQKTSPVSVKFFVKAPNKWDDTDKKRLESHFKNYNLAKRFAIEASNELATIREEFKLFLMSEQDRKSELNKRFMTYNKRYINSWQTALYQALVNSDWYCKYEL
ncbi:HNH endonuclease [Hydrogenimonas thermophila]|uniref:HNH endonuclease n=1 Tax=Hydrogenimonas thermophila TaxID=223786 RepID=A0A1I5KP52_9BACT|nr:hypothetical protein [Hydrogenimonas thermophila]SFO86702.1 hypothetical protein SAMN05216234_10111 [Hydrogenimonas thermophila]